MGQGCWVANQDGYVFYCVLCCGMVCIMLYVLRCVMVWCVMLCACFVFSVVHCVVYYDYVVR